MISARYVARSNRKRINIVRDGITSTISADMANADYCQLLASNVVIEDADDPVTGADVNAERDRRLKTFSFGGKLYDFCDGRGSDINIAGAGTLALAAIMAGAQANDLRWADPAVDFSWVAADNSIVTMDAQTCLNFAKAAADWKAKHIRKARALKDMNPIPADYASDIRWTS